MDRVCVNAYPQDSALGKEAETFFHIVREGPDYVMGLAFPRTGRQHQIRVHARVNGFPLVGDKLYCGSYPMFQRFKDLKATAEDHSLMQIPRQALHAAALRLPGFKSFSGPLPQDLGNWIPEAGAGGPCSTGKLGQRGRGKFFNEGPGGP